MTKIYVIRHAEAEGNLYRIAQGQYNSILTDRGWLQVEALKRRFADIQIDAVYSSDLYRTCATASAIYKAKGLPLHRRKALREICVGVWEQKTWGEIARNDPEQLENFNRRLHLWHTDGAETLEAVRDRVLACVQEIARENEGRTVAVFTHGCAIRLLLAYLQGYTMEEIGKTPHGDNTAVSLLEAENGELKVVFRDDNSHLQNIPGMEKRKTALEPGLYFEPMRLQAQERFLHQYQEHLGGDGGCRLAQAVTRPALAGMLKDKTVGLIQFRPDLEAEQDCGWIALHCVDPEWRGRGYGVQLLGQAVQYYRPLGRQRLRMPMPEDNAVRDIFGGYGFHPLDRVEQGMEIWEKDISYRPEFLSE